MSMLQRRMMMAGIEEDGDMAKEWKLIGTKTFSEADFGTNEFTFQCDECTEFFICDDNLLSNQSMGYGIKINDISASNNHKVRNTEGIRHREIELTYKGNRWCESYTSCDYDAFVEGQKKTVIGKKNTSIGKANSITITQSSAQDYQIYAGTIEIFGR